MIENFKKPSRLEELTRISKLSETCRTDFGKTEAEWQQELDGDLKVLDIDNRAGNELLFEHYLKKINGVNSQESYDKVFDEYYKILWLTARLIQNAQLYRNNSIRILEDLEKAPDSICPCCGAKISDEFISNQHAEIDEIQRRIDFYEFFLESRKQEIQTLQRRAEKKDYKVHGLDWLNVIFQKTGL